MSSHTMHPDSHKNGLSDTCPRCYEHSLHPFETLDEENLRQLTLRVREDAEARSENERTAMNVIELVLFRHERLRTIGAL